MPHAGYANPITNDGLGFHSDMPVSELTECYTRAIKASDVSSTPPAAKPLIESPLCMGLEESWTHKETECAITE